MISDRNISSINNIFFIKVGSFLTEEEPISVARDVARPLLGVARSYVAQRRERRQTGIVKKNYYELMTPSEGKLSPIGQIAKLMMKQVLKAKGKEAKDVIPYDGWRGGIKGYGMVGIFRWQRTVQKISNSATRRKAIKKKLEEDSVESLDQLIYRGLKKQGAVEEDVRGRGRGNRG